MKTEVTVTDEEPASTQAATAHTETVDAAIQIRCMRAGDDLSAFRTLNEEWILLHFSLEAKDIEMLGDPENLILRKGGYIYMLYADTEPVGCVALLPMGDGVYELSKMAIAPHFRGKGLGRRLLQHAISEARLIGARSLFLGSSTKLPDAVHLYEAVGFQHVGSESLPPMAYTRASIFMAMTL